MSKNLKKLPKKRRDKFIPPIRATADELEHLRAKACEAGMSFSAYCRTVLLEGKVVVVQQETNDNREIIRLLLALGRNINQIAKVLHIMLRDFQGADGYDAVRIHTTLDHCDDALEQLEASALDLMT